MTDYNVIFVAGDYARKVTVPCCYWQEVYGEKMAVVEPYDKEGYPHFDIQKCRNGLYVGGNCSVVSKEDFSTYVKSRNKALYSKYGKKQPVFLNTAFSYAAEEIDLLIGAVAEYLASSVEASISYEKLDIETEHSMWLIILFAEDIKRECLKCKGIKSVAITDEGFVLERVAPERIASQERRFGPKKYIMENWKQYNLCDTLEDFKKLYAILEASAANIDGLHSAVMNGDQEFCGIVSYGWDSDRELVKTLFDFHVVYTDMQEFIGHVAEEADYEEISPEEYLAERHYVVTSEGLVEKLYY